MDAKREQERAITIKREDCDAIGDILVAMKRAREVEEEEEAMVLQKDKKVYRKKQNMERVDIAMDGEDEENNKFLRAPVRLLEQSQSRRDCPYLDTINRHVLDFDFEKCCSISLATQNVYACLVCGKYFQGRGPKSHAFTHSLQSSHHVFINLQTENVYCLPNGYKITDPSLDDIRRVLNPRFTMAQLEQLDRIKEWARALDGSHYIPGMVGLNNVKEVEFLNVVIQSLMRVTPFRDFFLIPQIYRDCKSRLVHKFGELARKIWNPHNFKGQVSPHEFLQAALLAREKHVKCGVKFDIVDFMSWLLTTLHADLGGSGKQNSSIISECFQGELEVTKEVLRNNLNEKKGDCNDILGECDNELPEDKEMKVFRMRFLMLGLDLPPCPLFKDAIPQVPLFDLLKKFNGESITKVWRQQLARMQYRVVRLPQYLILHMRRFTENNFFIEKNPTLVNFPLKNLELKDHMALSVARGIAAMRSKYDLIANIVHDGTPGKDLYRAFVQRKSDKIWYEMQDLHVRETLPQMVALSEAYMQVYELQRGSHQ